MPIRWRAPRNHENRPTVDGCSAGVSLAVARASCPCAGAGRSRPCGRDARATIFRAAENLRNYRFSELRRFFLPVTAA